MKRPSTQKIVEHIIHDYQLAARAMGKVEEKHPQADGSFLNPDNLSQDATNIEVAYDKGLFDDVTPDKVEGLMEKYGAVDIYHLTASYFNATGHILNVVDK